MQSMRSMRKTRDQALDHQRTEDIHEKDLDTITELLKWIRKVCSFYNCSIKPVEDDDVKGALEAIYRFNGARHADESDDYDEPEIGMC